MLLTLDDPHTLARRIRRPILIAAALVSAVLAPLVDQILLGSLVFEGGAVSPSDLVRSGLWAAGLAALLGAWAAHLVLRADRPGWLVLVTAPLAGVLYLPLLLTPFLVPEILRSSASEALRIVSLPFVILVMGAVISAPAGFLFGLVFASGVVPAQRALAEPTHASPARSSACAAVMLGLAALLAVLLAGPLAQPFERTIFVAFQPLLEGAEVHGLAWARTVLFPAPLVLAAVLFASSSAWQHRRLALTKRALADARHPLWVLDVAGEGELASVRSLDEEPAPTSRVVRARGHGDAYRAVGPALARLGVSAPLG